MKGVSATVCGPLLEALAEAIGFEDSECVEFFRKGTSLYSPGQQDDADLTQLRRNCKYSNYELLQSLREDPQAAELHRLAWDDYEKGRMSKPVPVCQIDLTEVILCVCACTHLFSTHACDQVRLVPRFAVVQGLKPDGSDKVRAIDNMSWSAKHGQRKRSRAEMKAESINGHYTFKSMVEHDHLDQLLDLLRLVHEKLGVVPSLWKADIDAAYRRLPISPEHAWAAGIVYMFEGVAWCSVHHAAPFGATSSVEAWHRVGALLASIATEFLRIPVLRYVDDYFSVERCETNEHAMTCFARLVRALLGQSAIAERKLECGPSLVVLGMLVNPSPKGVRFTLDKC